MTPSYVDGRGSFEQVANNLTNSIWRDSAQRSIIIADKIRTFNCKCCETFPDNGWHNGSLKVPLEKTFQWLLLGSSTCSSVKRTGECLPLKYIRSKRKMWSVAGSDTFAFWFCHKHSKHLQSIALVERIGRPWSTIIQRSISVTISYSSFNFESVGNRSIKPSSSWKISAPMFPHLSPFFIYYTPSISLPIDTILLQKTVIPSRCLFF